MTQCHYTICYNIMCYHMSRYYMSRYDVLIHLFRLKRDSDLMKRSSRGVSSRLRGSTRSGNWAMERHSRLRKLGKSVLSSGSQVAFSCSRNSVPTSPLSMTSQPGSPLRSVPSSSSLSSSSSASSFSTNTASSHVSFAYMYRFNLFNDEMYRTHRLDLPPSPAARSKPSRTSCCPSLWRGSCQEGRDQVKLSIIRHLNMFAYIKAAIHSNAHINS